MKRMVSILLILVAVVSAFLLGRWSREPAADAPVQAARAVAGESETAVDASTDAARFRSALPPSPDAPSNPRPGSGGDQQTPHVSVSAKHAGPQPLRPEDLPPLDKTERVMAADGGVARDMLDLAHNEPQDDRARQLEVLIAQSILRHGGRYTGLRLSPPHCTRSVCFLRGVGAGMAQNPSSDWQRLSGAIMSEPWFREFFDDTRTMVGGEGQDTVYITLYVRCAPGTCRYGNR